MCIAACLIDICPFFFFFLSLDIFTSVFWSSEAQNSPRVDQLMENLKSTVLASRASGTFANYLRAFNKWRPFASDVLGTSEFPVRPIDCALYLQHLLESSKSVASINCAFYAFKWVHLLAGVDSPTLHPTVIAVKEGAVRLEDFTPVTNGVISSSQLCLYGRFYASN